MGLCYRTLTIPMSALLSLSMSSQIVLMISVTFLFSVTCKLELAPSRRQFHTSEALTAAAMQVVIVLMMPSLGAIFPVEVEQSYERTSPMLSCLTNACLSIASCFWTWWRSMPSDWSGTCGSFFGACVVVWGCFFVVLVCLLCLMFPSLSFRSSCLTMTTLAQPHDCHSCNDERSIVQKKSGGRCPVSNP